MLSKVENDAVAVPYIDINILHTQTHKGGHTYVNVLSTMKSLQSSSPSQAVLIVPFKGG